MNAIRIFAWIMIILGIFAVGFTLGSAINQTTSEQPTTLTTTLTGAPQDQPSPQNWIKEDQIHVYSDKVVLDINNPQWARFLGTKSMDPVFDSTAHGIEIVPQNSGQLQVGDVASYQYGDNTIIHRIKEIGQDDQGWYAIFKGDNNPAPDPEKVRWSQIKRVLVAVVY